MADDQKSRRKDSRRDDLNFDGKVIPCDIVLVRGNCVVNEAMLTGESVSKVKESVVDNQDQLAGNDGELVDVTRHANWSRHVLLGGTLLQQHGNSPSEQSKLLLKPSSSTSSSSRAVLGAAQLPLPPDGGCVGIVLRTGFGTTQVRP
jgi:manganese-transporting P-type ATPase